MIPQGMSELFVKQNDIRDNGLGQKFEKTAMLNFAGRDKG